MKLKTLILTLALATLVFASIAGAEKIKIYKSDQVVVPAFTARPDGFGGYSVYKSGQTVIPSYKLKKTPSGYSIYPAGKPVVPLYRVKNGEVKK